MTTREWLALPKAVRRMHVANYRDAKERLAKNAAKEKARGIQEETITYQRLNTTVARQAARLPWWRR